MADNKSHQDLVQLIGGMTVMQLNDLVKALEETFGVSAAAPVAAAAPAAASAESNKEEEKSQYKVTLESIGSDKIKVIKALRSVIPNLGLTEAKQMAEDAPSTVSEAASKDDAQKIQKTLEEAGAKVKLS